MGDDQSVQKPDVLELLRGDRHVQMGGKATTGKGRVRLMFRNAQSCAAIAPGNEPAEGDAKKKLLEAAQAAIADPPAANLTRPPSLAGRHHYLPQTSASVCGWKFLPGSSAVWEEATDFDAPVPVPFLSVKGAFSAAILANDVSLPKQWLETAASLLTNALAETGIGGKTNSGYGSMRGNIVPHPQATASNEAAGQPPQLNQEETAILTHAPPPGKGNWRIQIEKIGFTYTGVLLESNQLRLARGKRPAVGDSLLVTVLIARDKGNIQCRQK